MYVSPSMFRRSTAESCPLTVVDLTQADSVYSFPELSQWFSFVRLLSHMVAVVFVGTFIEFPPIGLV